MSWCKLLKSTTTPRRPNKALRKPPGSLFHRPAQVRSHQLFHSPLHCGHFSSTYRKRSQWEQGTTRMNGDVHNSWMGYIFYPRNVNRPLRVSINLSMKARLSTKFFVMKISFHSNANKTNFHMKSFALSLTFIMRFTATQKWPKNDQFSLL